MRSYGQFCPVAKAAEIVAERPEFLVVRVDRRILAPIVCLLSLVGAYAIDNNPKHACFMGRERSRTAAG